MEGENGIAMGYFAQHCAVIVVWAKSYILILGYWIVYFSNIFS